MNKEAQFEELIAKVLADEVLQKKCAAAVEAGKAEELLKEMGYDFSLEELIAYIEDKNEDLSTEELDAVAGGKSSREKGAVASLTVTAVGILGLGILCHDIITDA